MGQLLLVQNLKKRTNYLNIHNPFDSIRIEDAKNLQDEFPDRSKFPSSSQIVNIGHRTC